MDWASLRKYFKLHSSTWTSGNSVIDKIIKDSQFHATSTNAFLEWIPFADITNMRFHKQMDKGHIYKADWRQGSINNINEDDLTPMRCGGLSVALKAFNHSVEFNDIINEVFYKY